MKFPRSLNHRLSTAQRKVTPPSAGGRTDLVSPPPSLPARNSMAGYSPLTPWGSEGAATFSQASALWHGIYDPTTEASFQFGLGDNSGSPPAQTSGLAFMGDSADETAGYAALLFNNYHGDAILDLLGSGGAHIYCAVGSSGTVAWLDGDGVDVATTNDGHWHLHANPDDVDFQMNSDDVQLYALVRGVDGGGPGDGSLEIFDNSANQRIGLHLDPTHTWLEFLESGSDPSAPAANGARVFTKDNGAGKTQLCVRFNSGATQVVATQP